MVQKFHASLPLVCNNAFFFGFVPGKDHERQRKIIAPIFFASQLKVYLPIFQDAASKVCAAFPLLII
jgi:cytochrome P450